MVDKNAAPINKIYAATKSLIEKYDIKEVTEEKIAEESNVSIALIKQYFPDGPVAILKGVIQQQSTDFLEKVDFNIVSLDNLAQSLKYLLKLFVKSHKENAAFYRAMELAFLQNRDIFKGYEEILTVELIAAPLVAQALRQFGFKEGADFQKLVKLIIHTLDSLVHRHVIYSNVVDDDNILIDFLISLSVGFINYSVQFQDNKF